MTFAVIVSVWGLGTSILIYQYREVLLSLWREPVFRRPVVIFESDDWGPGPDRHASVLRQLIEMLREFRDSHGRCPVMTLGMVLALPDNERMRQEGLTRYRRRHLDDPQFGSILEAVQLGRARGVFSVQLHGMEHFWPDAVMSSSEEDGEIREWLTQEPIPNTEDLPPHLQSRWIDASTLPSRSLRNGEIQHAVSEEVDAFTRVFGTAPTVVVPPTFIWNTLVEQSWSVRGIQVIVTPGRRYEYRDVDGAPVQAGAEIRNSEVSSAGLFNVVRNDYFEPSLGHRAEKALLALAKKTRMGRPTLFETHRFNFTGDENTTGDAIAEVRTVIQAALSLYPDLVFTSTEQLAMQMKSRPSWLIEARAIRRIPVWLRRIYGIPRLRKISWITGLALLAVPIMFWARPSVDVVDA